MAHVPEPAASIPEVSLVADDLLIRLQRTIGLAPRKGFGTLRRAVILALVSWLPLAVWAFLQRRAIAGAVAEPLLEHFTIHVRCLVAIPLLVLSEQIAHRVSTRLFPQFVHGGLVPPEQVPRFATILERFVRLRNRSLPWVVMLGFVIAWTAFAPVETTAHELVWASEPDGSFGFGGLWFLYVARPIYVALMLAWIWRYVLLVLLLFQISRLDLALVPSHPDEAGGLGFLEQLPSALSLVVLACSALACANWAHQEVYHGVTVQSQYFAMCALVTLLLVMFLAPLLLFAPLLRKCKRRALLDYSALVGRHGRLVHRRWIQGQPVDDDAVLRAPEIGPVADTLTLYAAVRAMKIAPIGKASLLSIAIPAALPILAVIATQIPIREMLLKILKMLA